jgi:DNA-binding FrmR family transcriptional regulator
MALRLITTKDRALHRLKIISGQLNGILSFMEKDKSCLEILTQTLAVRKALESLDELLLADYIQARFSNAKNLKEKELLIKEVRQVCRLNNN